LLRERLWAQVAATVLWWVGLVKLDYVVVEGVIARADAWEYISAYHEVVFSPVGCSLVLCSLIALCIAGYSLVPLLVGVPLVYAGPLDLAYFLFHGMPLPKSFPWLEHSVMVYFLRVLGEEAITPLFLARLAALSLTVSAMVIYLYREHLMLGAVKTS